MSGNDTKANLFEVYRICKEVPLTIRFVNSFHEKYVSGKDIDFIWNRRKDLFGCKLKVNYFDEYPHVIVVNKSDGLTDDENGESKYLQAGNLTLYGTEIELFKNLMQELNFSVEWIYVSDRIYGQFNSDDQTWTGIMGQLQSGKAEMTIFQMSVLLSRSLFVQFSIPTASNDFGLYMQTPKQSLTWSTFSKVISLSHWMAVLIVGIICSLVLCSTFGLLDRKRLNYEPTTNTKVKLLANNLGSGISVVGLSLAQGDVNHGRQLDYSSANSMKILYFTVCLFGSFNFMFWDAGLTSTLTVQNFELPINNLKDLLSKRDYQLMVWQGAASEAYFVDAAASIESSDAKTLWKETMKGNKKAMTHSTEEQEEVILRDKKNVVFTDPLSANLWATYPCKITSAKKRYFQHSIAYPFKKNSTFIKVFDNALNKLMETGSLKSIHRHKLKFKPLSNCNEERDLSLGYQNILTAFVVSGIGLFIAIMTMVVERIYSTSFSKIHKTNDDHLMHSRSMATIQEKKLKDIKTLSKLIDKLDHQVFAENDAFFINVINKLIEKLDCNIVILNSSK